LNGAFASASQVAAGSSYEFNAAPAFIERDSMDSLSYELISGPAWLRVDAVTGILRGSPLFGDVGTSTARLRASDQFGGSVEWPCLLTVVAKPGLAVNFCRAGLETQVSPQENTDTLIQRSGLPGTLVWENQAINSGRGQGVYAGVEVRSFSSTSWQVGSSLLIGAADASQQVFYCYLDDGDGAPSYASGDQIGASVHVSGLDQFLANAGAAHYTVTVFMTSHQGGFQPVVIRAGAPVSPSGIVSPPLQTISPALVGDGNGFPQPTLPGSNAVRRACAKFGAMNQSSVTISCAARSGNLRGCIAGIAITPANSPAPSPAALGRGGYYEWASAHFGPDADDDSIAGETADPNRDGLDNLLAYAMGLDPMSAATPLLAVKQGDEIQLSYQANLGAAGVSLVLEWSADLGDAARWAPVDAAVEVLGLVGGAESRRVTVGPLSGESRRFFRLRASR
jgi:hypothetical protein